MELHDAKKCAAVAARYHLITPGYSTYALTQVELAMSLMSAGKFQKSLAAAQRSLVLNAFEPSLYSTMASDYESHRAA